MPESCIVVIPIVPEVYSSNVHVPVVVKPPAVIIPDVVSSALFFKKASSTLNCVPDKVKFVPPV